ncbi:MAG: hypothetical protein A2Y15_08670 [Clostridiales bacterium GWF2_36_10]|nr:MAG: hypothetical protein A2Y15_08670 [Clostridiales bacterium GWF2_36_10]HAN20416.1 terminase [Clostridiales bacterium]
MAGRNALPIDIIEANGKSHFTKAQIKQRKNAEIKLGNDDLKCPKYIKNNTIAFKKWKEIIAIYKNTEFISSADVGLIGRYCITYSEYNDLLERRNRISNIHADSDDLEDYINDTDEFNHKVKRQLMDMISTTAILNIDAAINKKMDMLIKMEDRMFLNPLAKVKNVPKPEEKKPANKFDKFGGGGMNSG